MKDKTKYIVQICLFAVILLVVFIANILKEDKLISISEKRSLDQMPNFNISDILDGSFFKNFDNYTSDQFFVRDDLRKLATLIDLNIRREYHKLAIKNGYIYEKNLITNINSVNNFIRKIKTIEKMYLSNKNNIYYSVIPDKNYFGDNSYDDMINLLNKEFNYKYINIFNDLKLEDYYKTDQHWKQENLKFVAKRILENMNKNFVDDYEEKNIKDFSGTYGNQIAIFNETDILKVLTSDTINNCKVFNYELNTETKVYDDTNTNIDAYNIYLNGPVSIIEMTNTNIQTNDELIIFRDSFGSSLAPLLINQYKKITLIDTRYIKPDLISNYVKIDNQDILFIYSTMMINNSYTLK